MNKLVEREAFIDSVRVKSSELKDKFLFEVSIRLSVFPWCRECPQIVMGTMVWEFEMARS